jgi:L-2-amino-thiazoline-4-carboxylic acid hydrolase
MATKSLPLSQVSTLPYYGRHFPFIPWRLASKLRVSSVFAKCLWGEIGAFRFAAFWLRLPFRLRATCREFRAGFRLMRSQFGFIAEIEWILLVLIYRDLEKMEGKEKAYGFAQKAIQQCSEFMMNDFYQADRLAKFADPFEAFWSYHKAMFLNDPNYPNEMIDHGDLKIMIVHQCRNCEIAHLTIPELAPLGCDHDITGYKAIGDRTQMEFRRLETLAKDGKPCRFMFYRRGKAPPGDYEVH